MLSTLISMITVDHVLSEGDCLGQGCFQFVFFKSNSELKSQIYNKNDIWLETKSSGLPHNKLCACQTVKVFVVLGVLFNKI